MSGALLGLPLRKNEGVLDKRGTSVEVKVCSKGKVDCEIQDQLLGSELNDVTDNIINTSSPSNDQGW